MPAYAEKAMLQASSMLFQNKTSGASSNSNWTDIIDLSYRLAEDFDSIDGKMVRVVCLYIRLLAVYITNIIYL